MKRHVYRTSFHAGFKYQTCMSSFASHVNVLYIIGSGRKQPPVFYNRSCFVLLFSSIFAVKYLCWFLFLIKNFKAILLKRKKTPTQVFSCEYCGIFKIICFEERLRTAASIICYFDTINLKQSCAHSVPKPFKGATKSYFTHYSCEIIVLFNTALSV